jgi:ABC-type dipeptide/oligopeptide/nickel transport system ATPase component
MSNMVLVIGESGTGKSTSIRNLNSEETFIINILDKPLPFKGYKKNYKKITQESAGNYFASDDIQKIKKMLIYIAEKMPEIKNVIIDDFQYLMANEFMRRAKDRGFDKFTEIAQNAWSAINQAQLLRDDLTVYFLSHSEFSADGLYKCKTIGKMLDDKITLEGMFTIVLHTTVKDGKYKFLTQHDGAHIAKSPQGMFEDLLIDNDLSYVHKKMNEYFIGE